MNFVRGIRRCNVRAFVHPKRRAFFSTISSNGNSNSMISRFHGFAQEHSVCYKAASTYLSKRGVFSMVDTDIHQRYFVKCSGFVKHGSKVYVNAENQLVISGYKTSLLGIGKCGWKFEVPIADYSDAVIDAKYYEELQGILVDISSFVKPRGVVFTFN